MAEPDPNEFTEREKFLLSYYRSPELSGSWRTAFYDIVLGLVSIALVVSYVLTGETAYGFVGYALLLGRLYYIIVEGARWTGDIRNIVAKFDAKLAQSAEPPHDTNNQ